MEIPRQYQQATQQFAQSLEAASRNIIEGVNIYRKAEIDNQVATAAIRMKERVADKMIEFQNTAFRRGEDGQFLYKSFGETFAQYSTDLWNEELSLIVTDPLAVDRVHQAFNEFVVDQQNRLKAQGLNWMRDEQAYNLTTNIDETIQATSMTAQEKRDGVFTMVVQNRDAGILDPAAAKKTIDDAYYAIGLKEAWRLASAETDYEKGRAFLETVEGIRDSDRQRLLSLHDSQERRRKAVEAELKKERTNAAMEVAQEQAWEGMTEETFLELTKPGKPFEILDAPKIRTVMGIIQEEIRERENDAKGIKLTTSEVITNMIELAFQSKDSTRENIFALLDSLIAAPGETFDPKKHLTGEDRKNYVKRLDSKDFMRLNDTATKQVIALFKQAVKDGELTEAEKEYEIDNHYRWMGDGRWDSDRFVNDTKFSDEEKLQRAENRIKPYALNKVANDLRRIWDPMALSKEERAQQQIAAGKLLGMLNVEGLQEVIRLGDLAKPADVERILAGGKDPAKMTGREKTMYENNVKLANLIRLQKDLFTMEYDVAGTTVDVQLEGTGRPVFVVDEERPEYRHAGEDIAPAERYEKAFYTIKIEDKDEVWYKWDPRIEAWLPDKTAKAAEEDLGARQRIIQEPTKRQTAINELRRQIRLTENQIKQKKAAIMYKPGMRGGQADQILQMEAQLEQMQARMAKLRAAEEGQ